VLLKYDTWLLLQTDDLTTNAASVKPIAGFVAHYSPDIDDVPNRQIRQNLTQGSAWAVP
jgi:hypothetical protein